jgi:signal transduction histidine kinase
LAAGWGVIAASKTREEPVPADTESRIGDFTDLVATAISNAEARADLVASRERVLTAGDEARRRVVRDLHDGAQQRFVHATITLELAIRAFETDQENGGALVAEALEHAQAANRELRELAHGLLADVLTQAVWRPASNRSCWESSRSTRARSTRLSRPGSRTAACGSTCATTVSEAHARMEAACWGCAIAL